MIEDLSREEMDYVRRLMTWDRATRRLENLWCHAALVAAGICIVGAIGVTAADLNDRRVILTLVPGVIVGLFFVWLYIAGESRLRERHRLAVILKKLTDTA